MPSKAARGARSPASRGAAPADCPECRVAAGKEPPRGLTPLRRGAFVVHPKTEAPPVPGWFVVAPLRHVEQVDALAPAELRELGPLVAQVAAALRAETPTAKIYSVVFAEVLAHLHVHVIARPPDLPGEERGPGVFLAQGTRDADPDLSVARRVLARLAKAGSRKRRRAPVRYQPTAPSTGQSRSRTQASRRRRSG